MVLSFFRRHVNDRERAAAERLPPGPRVDLRSFEFLNHDHPDLWDSNGYHNHADPWREEHYG